MISDELGCASVPDWAKPALVQSFGPFPAGMIVERVSSQKLRERRAGALERLGMSLSEAREQWDEDGCCLLNGNWHNLADLEIVKDADWLLDESMTNPYRSQA